MTDDVDCAQAAEQSDRDLALKVMFERIAASFQPRRDGIDGICIDCQEPIEPVRLQVLAGKTSRCAACARDFEHRQRSYR